MKQRIGDNFLTKLVLNLPIYKIYFIGHTLLKSYQRLSLWWKSISEVKWAAKICRLQKLMTKSKSKNWVYQISIIKEYYAPFYDTEISLFWTYNILFVVVEREEKVNKSRSDWNYMNLKLQQSWNLKLKHVILVPCPQYKKYFVNGVLRSPVIFKSPEVFCLINNMIELMIVVVTTFKPFQALYIIFKIKEQHH